MEPGAEDGIANLANALIQARQWRDAGPHLRRLIAIAPDQALAHYNVGVAAMHLGRYAATAIASARARALDPAHGDAVYNEAQACLALGDWHRGFELYEHRWSAPSFPVRWPSFPGRRWTGEVAAGARLLLVAEQGHGDTIQFLRYVPLCRQRVGQMILVSPPSLSRLAATIPGLDVVGERTSLPEVDFHLPIASLPSVFGTTPETVPSPDVYRPDPSQVAATSKLLRPTRNVRIGICWKGNPAFVDDERRSPGLDAMRPFFQVSGVDFVSLVKYPGPDDLGGLPIEDPMERMHDFLDTAHLAAGLDGVITSDTAVAHLTGSLGMPVLLLLSAAADWRWLEGRPDTPWYPTMTLFRQSTLGSWREPVNRAIQALRTWLDRRDK